MLLQCARGALLSTLLHATLYMVLHNLFSVLVQIANKMQLQKKSALKMSVLILRPTSLPKCFSASLNPDCLRDLAVKALGCRSRGPGSIPSSTRFYEK
jgi:hypothetical protein